MRGGIVTRSDNNVGEALSGQRNIILEILSVKRKEEKKQRELTNVSEKSVLSIRKCRSS